MIASVLFAGMTGAAVSDTATFGNILVPCCVRVPCRRRR
jgi:TRAP-type C4-dicarboxylate transport system permease large subunit